MGFSEAIADIEDSRIEGMVRYPLREIFDFALTGNSIDYLSSNAHK